MEQTTLRDLFPVNELSEEISGFFGFIKTRLPRSALFAAQLSAPTVVDSADHVQANERKEAELVLKMQQAAEDKDMAALSGLFSRSNVDRQVKDSMRLSDLAAALGSLPMLQLVLDQGGQINVKNSAGQLPIHYALTSPDVPATVAFLLNHGADPNVAMPNGDYLMHKACSDSATTLLALLLQHGANPGCLDSQKHTPLHRACINDLKEHAEIVIDAASDLINQQDALGRTALHIAVENQNIQLMKMLLERGATIDRETEDGLTAIDTMMATKNRGALKELIVYFTDKVSKDVRAYKVTELYRSKHFRRFLDNLNCLHLAANCGCDTFLRLDTCQKAMDVAWYRFLLDVTPIYREIIILLGSIPLNPLVSLALYRDYQRSTNAEQERRLSMDAGQTAAAVVPDQTDGGAAGAIGGSSRNRRASFAIEDDAGEATSTMFSDALEFEPQLPSRRGTMAAKFSECCTLYYYFYQIPAVKFRYFTISHLILLCTLSYVVQFQLNASITPLEIFVYITAFGFVVEEVKKFAQSIWRRKLLDYVKNKWNIFDFFTSIVFLTGFILRLVVLDYQPYTMEQTMRGLFDNELWYCTRAFLGTYCLLLWVKLLNTSRVHHYFGPKLKMIYKMIIKDLVPFLFILIIFLLGFGIFMCSLLYPNGYYAYNPNQMGPISMAKRLVQFCFFSVFGEYHLDAVNGEGENCADIYQTKSNNTLACPNPQSTFIVPYILLPLYVTITTILLLSLIVALFSKTIEQIDCNSTALWQFERFFFITSYASNSSLPPPLNVLDMTRELFLKVCHRYLEQPQKPIEMDFFNQDVALKALIYQAIGMRNYRSELLTMCANTKEAKASTLLGVKRSASLFHH